MDGNIIIYQLIGMLCSIYLYSNVVDYVHIISFCKQVLSAMKDLSKSAKDESNIYSRMTTEPILVVNQWLGVAGKFQLPTWSNIRTDHNWFS